MKKKTNNKFVTSIDHLQMLVMQGHNDFAIVLAGGIGIFSRKTIEWNGKRKKFRITNHIDESKQNLSREQVMDEKKTNIGKAIPLNCLICVIE